MSIALPDARYRFGDNVIKQFICWVYLKPQSLHLATPNRFRRQLQYSFTKLNCRGVCTHISGIFGLNATCTTKPQRDGSLPMPCIAHRLLNLRYLNLKHIYGHLLVDSIIRPMSAIYVFQGSINCNPHPWKSEVFLVATVLFRENAIAAICASN